jgi:hypothetical protein
VDTNGAPEIKLVLNERTPGHHSRATQRSTAIQWKAFWSALGAAVALAVAVIPTLYGVAWWITGIAILAAQLVLSAVAGSVIGQADVFDHLRLSQKDRITGFTRLGIGVYATWAGVYVVRPEQWVWWVLLLPVVSTGVYWCCKWVEYRITHEPPKPEPVKDEAPEVDGDPEMIEKIKPVLRKAGHSGVRIISHEFITDDKNGTLVANQFLVQTPATGR